MRAVIWQQGPIRSKLILLIYKLYSLTLTCYLIKFWNFRFYLNWSRCLQKTKILFIVQIWCLIMSIYRLDMFTQYINRFIVLWVLFHLDFSSKYFLFFRSLIFVWLYKYLIFFKDWWTQAKLETIKAYSMVRHKHNFVFFIYSIADFNDGLDIF